jgi:hypothetical protein
MTKTLSGFRPQSEVTADGRARIAFGKVGVHGNDKYLVSTSDSGEILLTPLATIPKRELLIWENEQVRDSVLRGLGEAHFGKTLSRDDLLEGEDD